MCEQCHGFDEDDVDALAAAFVLRQGKTAPVKPALQKQAVPDHETAPPAQAKKAAR